MKEIYHNLKNYMLTALLVLSLVACGSHGNEQSGTDNSDTPAPFQKPVLLKEPTSVGE